MLLLLWWFSSSMTSGIMAFIDGVETWEAEVGGAPYLSGLLVRRRWC